MRVSDDANAQAEQAKRGALEAKLELAKFKADRELTPQQQEHVIAAITSYAGQQYFLSVSTDQESLRFVRILDRILSDAKWIKLPSTASLVVPGVNAGASAATEPGVRVQIDPSRNHDLDFVGRAFALSDALNDSGIMSGVAMVVVELHTTPDALQIRIGSKQ